jgi:small conductance mechanosensitive channel
LIGIGLKAMLWIAVIGMMGVQMTSFIAILGAAGLAIGMAFSGTLSNFAGGVMILIFKPFKIGHYITAQGHSGTVNEIQIFNTILKTPDNKTIIIPNGGLATGSMINFSTEAKRRVDFTFGIAYGDDVDKAKEVLMTLIKADERIINDPAEPFIAVSELADSSVNLVVRVWAEAANYWGIYFDLHEKVYKTFEKEGLNIPFPQMDVHVQK